MDAMLSFDLGLAISVVIAPSIFFIMNWSVRSSRGLAQSSGADWLLLFLVLDVNLILEQSFFSGLVRSQTFRTDFLEIAMLLFLVGFCFWLLATFKLETSSNDSRADGTVLGRVVEQWGFACCWALGVTIALAHGYLFLADVD